MRILITFSLLFAITGTSFALDPALMSNPPEKPAGSIVAPPPEKAEARQGGNTVLSALVITELPFYDTGTTAGYTDDYDEICPYLSTSPDVVYTFTPGEDINVNIDLCGSAYDTKLYVYDSGLFLVACNDDYYTDDVCGPYVSLLELVPLIGGEQYYIIIDGYGGDWGDYVLEVNSEGDCNLEIPAGAALEGEPPLQNEQTDDFNGGCNSEFEDAFQVLSGDDTGSLILGGVSGWYISGGAEHRDTDWFLATFGPAGVIELTADAERPLNVFELGPQDCATVTTVQDIQAGPCAPATMTITGEPFSTVWIFVGPPTYWSPNGTTPYEFDYIICLSGLDSGTSSFVVHPDGSGDFPTIQAAIDAVPASSTIELTDGMFVGDGNRDLDYKGKAITVRSQSGDPALCYINCEGYVDDPHFGFVFHTGEGLDSVLDGVGIIQGFYTSLNPENFGSADAAGITCQVASPTIRNCDISHGTAFLPAGVMIVESGLVGSGVAIYRASPVFEDCRITWNTLTIEDLPSDGQAGWLNIQAAGIACLEASPIIQNCTISNNIAEISTIPIPLPGPELPEVVIGGGMAVYGGINGEVLTTDYCTLQGNSVILNLTETPDIEITQISVAGGMALINHQTSGMAVDTPAPMFIENSVTIVELAGYGGKLTVGGGMSWVGDDMSLLNPRFIGNSVDLPSGLNCPYTAAGAIAAEGASVFATLGEFSGNWASATPIPLPNPVATCSAAGAIAGIEIGLGAENCNFYDNQISATPIPLPDPQSHLAAAGAVVLRESGALLSGCNFEENTFELGQNAVAATMDTLFCSGAMVQLATATTASSCEFFANRCSIGEDGGPGLDLNYLAAAGGFLQSSGSALLTEVHFFDNTTQVFGDGTQLIAGGAVTDPVTITRGVNCLFGDNNAHVQGVFEDVTLGGAGGFGEQSHPDFESCHMWNNHASVAGPVSLNLATVGGALAIRAANPLLAQCGFYGNTGTLGVEVMTSLAGGVAFQYGSPELTDCIFEANSATSSVVLCEQCSVAGGLALRESAATLTGSTLVSNSGSRQLGTAAGGIDCRQNTTLTMTNTIIAFSGEGSALEAWDGSNAELSCSNIFGNPGGDWVGYIDDQLDANGNIWEDPLFCGDHNPDARLTLASNSPCAAAANPDCGLIGAFDVGCGASSVDDQVPLPTVLKLRRGYPNPFNPQVTIKFDLPKAQQVSLKVYTLAGEMVTTLVHEVKTAGHHEVVWNGRDSRGREMSSGSYLVRLETASGAEGQKLMLVR